MLRALRRLISRGEFQLSLDFAPSAPASPARPQAARQPERTHPADEGLVLHLSRAHRELNAVKFGGELSNLPIRVSRRMKSRLGHYTLRGQERCPAEIVISRRHIRRHGWDEAVSTLLHEMVHQWQDETGKPVDHGAEFRRKSLAVGITPRARRSVAQAG
ncbi:MAG: SprT-like domain-containing protein [Gemmatimonadaceae bacterium]